jgi:Ala-tRNA(Pro) deacylase
MDCTERLEGYLREHGVSFEVVEHPRAFTAQQIAASEHVPGRMFAKVVMAQTDGALVMLVLPATAAVDTRKASEVTGGRPVRMAAERDFAPRFPDCEAGAMPPFGNLYDVPVYVDKSLAEDETIVFEAGTHTDTMSMKFADYQRLVEPKLAEFAHHP